MVNFKPYVVSIVYDSFVFGLFLTFGFLPLKEGNTSDHFNVRSIHLHALFYLNNYLEYLELFPISSSEENSLGVLYGLPIWTNPGSE